MYQKQNVVFADGLIMLLVASLLLGAWSVTRSLSLVQPSTSTLTSAQSVLPVAEVVAAEAEATLPDPAVIKAGLIKDWQADMKQRLNKFTAAESNDYGIYIQHIDSGAIAGSHSGKEFITASLYKLFVAVEALKLVDKGQLSLGQVLANTNGRTLKQCILDTISVSDNPCGHALLSTTSLTVNKLQVDGYTATDLSGLYPVTTAKDVGRLFEHIYAGDLLSKSSNNLLLGALKAQQVNDRLPVGLPSGTTLAHKTGDLEGYAHDAGIVYDKNDNYIITILSGPDDSGRNLAERYTAMANLTAQVHKSIKSLVASTNDAGVSW